MTRRRAPPRARRRLAAARRARGHAAWAAAIVLASTCAPAGALGAPSQRRTGAQPPAARGVARSTRRAPCEGRARRVRAGHVRISFTCDGDVTWFEISANRALRSFQEPASAFGCERASSRSFRCQDIHSGAAPEGGGIATVAEPLCAHGAHLVLHVEPALEFEQPTGAAFVLKGPC